MKRQLLLVFVGFLFSASASAAVITKEMTISEAYKAMKAAGWIETGLDMLAPLVNESLQSWSVDQGVLILRYSTTSNQIVSLSFHVSDERPKATRKTFDFEVTSFDTTSGLLTIKTAKGKPREPAEEKLQPRSQTYRTSSVAGSGR